MLCYLTNCPCTLPSEAIERVPLFAGKDAAFQRLLAMAMKPVHMTGGEYIVHKVGYSGIKENLKGYVVASDVNGTIARLESKSRTGMEATLR